MTIQGTKLFRWLLSPVVFISVILFIVRPTKIDLDISMINENVRATKRVHNRNVVSLATPLAIN